MVRVGIIELQGDFLEHEQILRELGVETVRIKGPNDLRSVDALVIPGGESTVIGRLMVRSGLIDAVRELSRGGMPIMGTCAGAILLAKKVTDRVVGETNQPTLALMDITVVRNYFGRQRDSFIARVRIEDVGEVEAAFIRAPAIVGAEGDARITGFIEHPRVGKVGVSATQRNMIALTFHPEITGDTKVYKYFINLVRK